MKINKIWYDFSEAVSLEEIARWTVEMEKESCKRPKRLLPSEKIPCRRQPEECSIGVFLVTDRGSRCKEAMEKGVPFLFYLHEGNREECYKEIPYAVLSLQGITLSYLEEAYKRFMGIPWTILETERCIVREITEDDLDDLYGIYAEPSISLYTENLYEDKEMERAYIRDYIRQVYEFCGYGIWAVIHKESGALIGRAGLACREGFDTPELGYIIAVPYQRKGYASEVCSAILDYAMKILGFGQIRILLQEENEASFKLCKKLGFQKESEMLVDGKIMQQYIYTESMKGEKEREE